MHTRQRLDLHCSLGCASPIDLVVRGDRFARRAKAYHSSGLSDNGLDRITFQPSSTFQLVPGAYNRVVMGYSPHTLGQR